MRNKKKEAKFFCESCGSEVPRNSRTCPQCGKFFAAVRCPQCGRTGNNEDFINGCPTCGYAVNPDDGFRRGGYSINLNNDRKNASAVNGSMAFSLFTNRKKNNSKYIDSSLPIWVYAVSIVVLVILIFLLYSCL